MNRFRKILKGSTEQPYEPLHDGISERNNEDPNDASSQESSAFSYIEYGIFLLLGVSMLWAWNMMLAAGPYFQARFSSNKWMSRNFQASEISVSTIVNLGAMLVLTKMQRGASYPRRIIASLLLNMVVFALLAASTAFQISAGSYFGFLMVMILGTSLATALCQNGIFAFASGFGAAQYTQGIMTGQAVAGVLPCVVEIVAVLSAQAGDEQSGADSNDGKDNAGETVPVRPSAAMAYFVTATTIAVVTLIAFFYLLQRKRSDPRKTRNLNSAADDDDTVSPGADTRAAEDDDNDDDDGRKSIPLLHLFRKLFWLAAAVFLTFAITMVFPVFTQQIVSVRPPAEQPAILQPASFIPLAFLFWNAGDLIGRMITAVPALSMVMRPRLVFLLAVLRLVFVGLYHLCNIHGRGAIVQSDFFYLVVVQFLFGLSNGYLGSTCMIGAGSWVLPEEREAAGGFMSLCLVGGLTVGSLLSFFVAGN